MALEETKPNPNGFSRRSLFPLKALAGLSLFSIVYIISSNERLVSPVLQQTNDLTVDEFDMSSIESTESTESIESIESSLSTRSEMLEVVEYRKKRGEKFYSWFEGNSTDHLLENIDADGAILDFVISGFAKCGTTSMEANLGHIAPMPISDVCTPVHNTVYYAYKNWPRQYDNTTNSSKILRGTKCPRVVSYLDDYSKYLPKTLIIVGIRHPVYFYQSFWNMMIDFNNKQNVNKSPYDFIDHCGEHDTNCYNECPKGQLLCLHRTRFHVILARAGKTSLDDRERALLAPDDKDGGMKLTNRRIKNPIFLYELSEIGEDYMWDELATLLKVPNIPHDIYKGSHKNRPPNRKRIKICDAEYDDFRAMIMPYAYNMSSWFCDYLVPVAKNESQNLHIANPDRFCEIVKDYVNDPCNRLSRLDNGTYTLRSDLDDTNVIKRW